MALPPVTLWPLAVGVRELRCAHQVVRTDKRYRQYTALGDDPQFRLKRRMPAGWYMLEVLLNLPVPSCTGYLYFDTGSGESEAQRYRLPLRSGKMAKRLIRLPATAQIRFDPCQSEGAFALQHFRLVRMTRRAALQRVHRKLAGDRRDAVRVRREASATADESVLWSRYDRLFAELKPADTVCYRDWIEDQESRLVPTPARQRALMAGWEWLPTFSVLVPIFDTDAAHLRACLDSVIAQTYPHWELCIADDASTQPHVRAILEEYATRDERVHVIFREQNGHIAAASNSALGLASGEFVALLDHDDVLAPHALFALAEALQRHRDAQLVYSDEDKLDAAGQRCDPYFKPDFAPDLLYSQNYISHLGVYRRELVNRIGGFRSGYDGSQDYDLLLRCLAHLDASQVLHVPLVLYHWRQSATSTSRGQHHKDYATDSARRALQSHFDAHQHGVEVSVIEPGLYRHRWPLPEPRPLASLIVPTRDGHEVLSKCIESIIERTTYAPYEIIIVDNQSTCQKTLEYLETLRLHRSGFQTAMQSAPDQPRSGDRSYGPAIRVLRYDHPFNYSAINNFAAAEASGTVLGLINNDVEVLSPEWLDEMVRHALRPDVGCVGAKLFYPDGSLQHAGVVLGIGGIAGHSHKYLPGDSGGYFSRLRVVHNVSAVTGAALVVRREVYEQVGGLDERHLSVAFNDVDFCLKCLAAGYRNVWTPFAELVHHESKTRGQDLGAERQARFEAECRTMLQRWGDRLACDPYYNPNLTLTREDYSLAATSRATDHGHC